MGVAGAEPEGPQMDADGAEFEGPQMTQMVQSRRGADDREE
jgi:hypothetical protein